MTHDRVAMVTSLLGEASHCFILTPTGTGTLQIYIGKKLNSYNFFFNVNPLTPGWPRLASLLF